MSINDNKIAGSAQMHHSGMIFVEHAMKQKLYTVVHFAAMKDENYRQWGDAKVI